MASAELIRICCSADKNYFDKQHIWFRSYYHQKTRPIPYAKKLSAIVVKEKTSVRGSSHLFFVTRCRCKRTADICQVGAAYTLQKDPLCQALKAHQEETERREMKQRNGGNPSTWHE